MTLWQRWVQRPQTLWVRKAFFQVHLWLGIAITLYIVLISFSGSAIIFRRELLNKVARPTPTIAVSGIAMNEKQLTQVAQSRYPGYVVERLEMSDQPDAPAIVLLKRGSDRIPRLFNPYSGEDMGNPEAPLERFIYWLADLHDNLLAGDTGRFVNGIAAILVIVVTLSGAVVWWPGSRTWKRGVGFTWQRAGFVRFNWDLHSVLGFWFTVIVLMWGVSAMYFCFPQFFDGFSDDTLSWLADLHFGRINIYTKVVWTLIGLIPAILTITGTLMWWYRVVSPWLKRKSVALSRRTVKEAISRD